VQADAMPADEKGRLLASSAINPRGTRCVSRSLEDGIDGGD